MCEEEGNGEGSLDLWVGLPLHLWTGEILRRISDRCRGFMALDKETALKIELL